LVELIFPSGFEHFFDALAAINAEAGHPAEPQRQRASSGSASTSSSTSAWVEDLRRATA